MDWVPGVLGFRDDPGFFPVLEPEVTFFKVSSPEAADFFLALFRLFFFDIRSFR